MIQLKLLQCQQCGAGLNIREGLPLLHCLYCRSTYLVEGNVQMDRLVQSRMVDFGHDAASAARGIRDWLAAGWFRPGDLVAEAKLEPPQPVLVPFHRVRCHVRTHYTADVRTKEVTETEERSWQPWEPIPGAKKRKQHTTERHQVVSGSHEGRYTDLLVPATPGILLGHWPRLAEFDLSNVKPLDPERAPLTEPTLPANGLDKAVQDVLEERERDACLDMVSAAVEDMRLNMTVTVEESPLVYLPLHLAAFTYRGTRYPVVVHGQTGEVVGDAPRSGRRILAFAAAVVAVPAAVFWFLSRRRR